MTFATEIAAFLEQIAQMSIAMGLAPRQFASGRKETLLIRKFSNAQKPHVAFQDPARAADASHHLKASVFQFEKKIQDISCRFLDLLNQTLRPFQHKRIFAEVKIYIDRKTGATKASLTIDDTTMTSGPVRFRTLVDRIDGLRRETAHIPGPGARQFSIQNRLIRADTPQDALLLYAALQYPGHLGSKGLGSKGLNTPPEIFEKIDAETVMQAMISENPAIFQGRNP